MATILSETKSTGGSPYAYYQVNATASDRTTNGVKIKVEEIGRLSSSSASLGTGSSMGLNGYITLYGNEYLIPLKGTSEKWSGTTKHTSSREITITNIPSTLEQLTNIKFRVSRTGSAANDYTKGAAMSSKTCSNLTIGIGHQAPSDITYTITEKNTKLTTAGISDTTYVNMLSIKEYNISATTYDSATLTEYNVYNGSIPAFRTENPVTIDYATKELALWESTGKVPIRVQVGDSMGSYVSNTTPLNPDLYDYIPYLNITLNETQTKVKRNGQISGKVSLNISGTFYNGSIGNINQEKPTIKYKFWKLQDSEPDTFDNVISSDIIEVVNNTFSVSDLEIGSSIESATNYFNPDYAYRVKVYVEDNFTNYTSQEKSIPVGEATWTEYKDRVDFKKVTIQGKDIKDLIFYKPDDTIEYTDVEVLLCGNVSNGTKNVYFCLFTPKMLNNITSVTIDILKANTRISGGGYLDGKSYTAGGYDYKSLYTCTATKMTENCIWFNVGKSSAFTNTPNNIPVVVTIHNLKLTFN